MPTGFSRFVRIVLWETMLSFLRQSGDAYRCFCSVDELDAKKRHLRASGSTSTYDRACRKLTEEEVARRLKAKERHIVRIDVSRVLLVIVWHSK
jgi:glutamyl-tRNA synthetase